MIFCAHSELVLGPHFVVDWFIFFLGEAWNLVVG